MYPAITNKSIIKIIQEYGNIMAHLNEQINVTVKELLNLNQNIYCYAAYKDIIYGSTGSGSGHADLSDTLKNMDKAEQEYIRDLMQIIYQLKSELFCNRRIHLCYMVLPFREHEVLRKMYEEKMSWGKLSEEYQVSISTLSRQRTRALKMIQIAYSSDLSNSDILHLQKVQKKITWQNVIQKYTKKEEKKEM